MNSRILIIEDDEAIRDVVRYALESNGFKNTLVARVRAHLRQAFEQETAAEIRRDGLVLNPAEHTARLNGKPLELTFTEYGILQMLAARPGRVYTRDQIVSRVKGEDYPVTDRAIDVQMVNLRRKLGAWAVNIETVRGIGYRMKAPL